MRTLMEGSAATKYIKRLPDPCKTMIIVALLGHPLPDHFPKGKWPSFASEVGLLPSLLEPQP